jgi:hypothetical protein
MFAPGCCFDPFITHYLSLSALKLDTDSGKVNFLAIKTGMPI